MNIHEYQAKGLMADYGIPVPKGGLATTVAEAHKVAGDLASPVCVVKAQVHAGGRGKGGGVKVCKSPEEVSAAAEDILGMTLVTHQTGPEGKLVRKVWVEEGTNIERELYLAVILDRSNEQMAIMASPDGGMDIEQVAEKTPERIFTTHIQPGQDVWPYQARKLLFGCGLEGNALRQGVSLIQALFKLAWEKEASLVEINPLVLTAEGNLIALDGKVNFDDSALFRHKEIAELNDPEETDPLERKAKGYGLNYVRLNGNVGTMVNGAGLAMATMDVIKMAGAAPAKLPGRRRRSFRGNDHQGIRDHPERPQREGHPDQHLRRHPALRRSGCRRGVRGPQPGDKGAPGGAPGRHQPRGGFAHHGQKRA